MDSRPSTQFVWTNWGITTKADDEIQWMIRRGRHTSRGSDIIASSTTITYSKFYLGMPREACVWSTWLVSCSFRHPTETARTESVCIEGKIEVDLRSFYEASWRHFTSGRNLWFPTDSIEFTLTIGVDHSVFCTAFHDNMELPCNLYPTKAEERSWKFHLEPTEPR